MLRIAIFLRMWPEACVALPALEMSGCTGQAATTRPTATEPISLKVLPGEISVHRGTEMVQPLPQLKYTEGPDTHPGDES